MPAQSLTWTAHRVADRASIDEARRFGEALDLTMLLDEPDKLMLQTERGDVVEYCTPDAEVPAHLFRDQDVVTGFLVDDLDAAASALRTAGFESVTEPTVGGPVVFQHFRGVDGMILGLITAAS